MSTAVETNKITDPLTDSEHQMTKKSYVIIENDVSVPCSQNGFIGPYPKSVESK
jgi:hypothetical protein